MKNSHLEKSKRNQQIRKLLAPFEKTKKEAQFWFESLRRGSDDAVFSELRQT